MKMIFVFSCGNPVVESGFSSQEACVGLPRNSLIVQWMIYTHAVCKAVDGPCNCSMMRAFLGLAIALFWRKMTIKKFPALSIAGIPSRSDLNKLK